MRSARAPSLRIERAGPEVRLSPEPAQPRHAGDRGVSGKERAVDRADRRPENEIRRDPALCQRLQHPHLVGPKTPPPGSGCSLNRFGTCLVSSRSVDQGVE